MQMTVEELLAEYLLAEYEAGRLTWEEYQSRLRMAAGMAGGMAAGAEIAKAIDDALADDPALEPDRTAPVVTLIGDTSITIEKGTTYVEQGATASDHDGSASVTITGDVDVYTVRRSTWRR